MRDIQRLARRKPLPLAEWVRRVLREARLQRSVQERQKKLKAVRNAVEYAFPTAEIYQMLAEMGCGGITKSEARPTAWER